MNEIEEANKEDLKTSSPEPILNLNEFKEELLRLHQKGRRLTMEHQKKYAPSHNGKKNKRLNLHVPGTQYETCKLCKEIVDTHNDYMKLESDAFGIVGIPYDNLMAAIRITEGILKMRENEK